MSRALRAAALATALVGCAGEGGAAGDAGPASDSGVRDASAVRDAALRDAMAADATADGAADAGGGGPPPGVAGEDYVFFDELAAREQGIVRFGFDAPEDAAAFVVTVRALDEPAQIRLVELRGPGGLLWSDLEDGPFSYAPTLIANLTEFVPYSFMVPNSPDGLDVAPGRYEVFALVGSEAGARVQADVVFRRGAAPVEGALDVVLWLFEGSGTDAAELAESARMQTALERFTAIYAAAGIEVAVREVHDVTGDGAAELAVVDDDAEFAAVLDRLAAEAAPEDRALHFAFVSRIAGGEGTLVRGRTAGVPGPPSHPDLPRRGAVVVGYEALPVAGERVGELLAHEAAHYLGLRHTSEYDGLRHDAIADTPECPAERATRMTADGSPALGAEDCLDLDGTNLLFYTPPRESFAQDQLTEGQRFVLLRNPALR